MITNRGKWSSIYHNEQGRIVFDGITERGVSILGYPIFDLQGNAYGSTTVLGTASAHGFHLYDVYLEVTGAPVFNDDRDTVEGNPGTWTVPVAVRSGGYAGVDIPTGTAGVKWGEVGGDAGEYTGGIIITSDLNYSPYMDIFTVDSDGDLGGNNPWEAAAITPRVRVGNLHGILPSEQWGIVMGRDLSNLSTSPYVVVSDKQVALVGVKQTWWDSAQNIRGEINPDASGATDLFWLGVSAADKRLQFTAAGNLTIKGNVYVTGGDAATQTYVNTAVGSASSRVVAVSGTWTQTDNNTITWTSVSIRFANGTTKAVTNGNTGNMSARTFLYVNPAADAPLTLSMQTSIDSIPAGSAIIAVAQNGADKASIQVIGGGTFIGGDWINTGSLSAISANLGTITAGTVTGATIQTATSGSRVVLSSATYGGIIGYGSSDSYSPSTGNGTYQVLWKKSDGKLYAGSGNTVIDVNGISLNTTEHAGGDPVIVQGTSITWNSPTAASSAKIWVKQDIVTGLGILQLRSPYQNSSSPQVWFDITGILDNNVYCHFVNTAGTFFINGGGLRVGGLTGSLANGYVAISGGLEVGTNRIRTVYPTSNDITVMATNRYLFASGQDGAFLNGNLYWDGSNWQRITTANPGTTILASADGSIRFRTVAAGANPATVTEIARFTANGRLGIGTDTPGQLLHVAGDAKVDGIIDVNSYLDVAGHIYHRQSLLVLNKAESGWRAWATRDTSSSDALMYLNYLKGVVVGDNSASNFGISLQNGYRSWSMETAGYDFRLRDATDGEDWLRIDGNDNWMALAGGGSGPVLIGTTSDDGVNKLQVNGTIAAKEWVAAERMILPAIFAPGASARGAQIFVDTTDGDLKVKFTNGTLKTIATN